MLTLKTNKRTATSWIMAMLFLGLIGLWIIVNQPSLYDTPIVRVIEVEQLDSEPIYSEGEQVDTMYITLLEAEMRNTDHQGEVLEIEHRYSHSNAYRMEAEIGDFFFVQAFERDGTLMADIIEPKRDHKLLFVFFLFLVVLMGIGRKQGLLAVLALTFHATLMAFLIKLFIDEGPSLLFLMGVGTFVMTVVSLVLVSGLTKKTIAAIASTIISLAVMLLIVHGVMTLTGGQGLRFEEMAFLTRHPEAVFTASLLVGALGAVMDVAVTINSSLFTLDRQSKQLSITELRKSGQNIGRDIMGTMTNILFFAYISGSIPTLLIYLLNDASLGFSINMNLSLELIRALSGGIGIVIAIPISIMISILMLKGGKYKWIR